MILEVDNITKTSKSSSHPIAIALQILELNMILKSSFCGPWTEWVWSSKHKQQLLKYVTGEDYSYTSLGVNWVRVHIVSKLMEFCGCTRHVIFKLSVYVLLFFSFFFFLGAPSKFYINPSADSYSLTLLSPHQLLLQQPKNLYFSDQILTDFSFAFYVLPQVPVLEVLASSWGWIGFQTISFEFLDLSINITPVSFALILGSKY